MIPTTVRRQTGSVTLVFLFSTVAVTLSLLAAIDIMRYNLVQSRLQSALDAAVLAAGRNLGNQPGQSGTEAWKADARAYLQANMPNGYLGSNYDISKVTISVTGDNKTGQTLKMSATGELPLLVAGFLSTKELPLSAANQAVRSSRRDLELVLVLDNTGSMNDSIHGITKLQSLKEASRTLVDTLFGEGNDPENFQIGIVPFSGTVKPRKADNTIPSDWLSSTTGIWPYKTTDTGQGTRPFVWNGCFTEHRKNDQIANPPVVGNPRDKNLTPYFLFSYGFDYPSTGMFYLNYPVGVGCNSTPTLFLNNNKNTINNFIRTISASGGTIISSGTLWGWRMLSPAWRGKNGWGSEKLPQDPMPYLTKAMIIMTDGENGGLGDMTNARFHQFGTPNLNQAKFRHEQLNGVSDYIGTKDYAAYYSAMNGPDGADLAPFGKLYKGSGTNRTYDNNLAKSTLDKLLLATCEQIKNDKIKIWTITFGDASITPSIKKTMQSCASEAYYHAPTGDQLKEIFKDIAGQLSELRLVQ